ncbi:MAG: hypothetical protein KA403_04645 [Candidatus Omnitrophica bacterium]|nr:hypothetical protein [Candidatus Omnitrophota bacterium]
MSSIVQNPSAVNKRLPIGLFVALFFAIVIATLYYAPSWGLMDDKGFLDMAVTYWQDPSKTEVVTCDFKAAGMYRPVVFIWATIFYKIFEQWPTGLYVLIAAGNMAAMLLWGLVFYRFFNVRPQDRYWTIFFFPLTFFLFTPFWNIFTYLSVQEKFIVFLAPLALILFQKTYIAPRPRDMILLYLIVVVGMLSKATFIFVPVAMFVYAFLDLIFFRPRAAISVQHLVIYGASLAYYAFYTVTSQLTGDYTAKFKSGLTVGGLIGKILGATMLTKVLLAIGIAGFMVYFVRAVRSNKREYLFPGLIYCGLIVYLVLLFLWGLYSYLLSALAPMVLGAMFPVYRWVCGRNETAKWSVNVIITVLLCCVFAGNIVPSISRMGDIGRSIAFLTAQEGAATDIYFMPPGYVETVDRAKKFTGKKIIHCGEGRITADMLSVQGKTYVMLIDLLPSIELSGVKTQDRVYANGTWEIYELVPAPGHEEKFKVVFKKTWLQELKVRIRDM